MRTPVIIKDNQSLFTYYHRLQAGDIICTRIRLKPGEEHLLLDLSARGINAIPSFISQLCSRSKAFQTRLFPELILPGTSVIYTIHDLRALMPRYGHEAVTNVVVKLERKNSGLGVFLFNSIEDVYTQAATSVLPYPFVIQPFIEHYRDYRVIIIGGYIEAYQRTNKNGFRKNLCCGGSKTPCTLRETQLQLCRAVMKRGQFPYAHIDLMETEDNQTYLTEINLQGGLRGAALDRREYQKKIEAVIQEQCALYHCRSDEHTNTSTP